MKIIKTAALFLWLFIFVVCAFLAGQYLVSKEIYSVFGDKKVDVENTDNKAKDTNNNENIKVSINELFAKSTFGGKYQEFVQYLVQENILTDGLKTEITDNIIGDYIFYALQKGMYSSAQQTIDIEKGSITISESEINSISDELFAKILDSSYKEKTEYGYSKENKTYTIEKKQTITSNTITYTCTEVTNSDEEISLAYTNTNGSKIDVYLKYINGNYVAVSAEKTK